LPCRRNRVSSRTSGEIFERFIRCRLRKRGAYYVPLSRK